jgi:hypothetical protein
MISLLAQAAAVLVTFAEPGFPTADVRPPLPEIPAAVAAGSVRDLDSLLRLPRAVLVWRHGSTFPLEAWPPIERFLRAGGHLLHLGGEPFTRPVSGPPGSRAIEPRTVTFLKALRLNQSHAVPVEGGTASFAGPLEALSPRLLPPGSTAWALEPKLAGPPRFPDEEGSPGRRDGVVRPLALVAADGDDPRFPVAAAALLVNWSDGPFAGGRWVLRPTNAPAAPDELALLLTEAAREPVRVHASPTLGTFHDGERPAVAIRWTEGVPAGGFTLTVRDTSGRTVARATVPADSVAGAATVAIETALPPGLYRVRVRAASDVVATTGFWVFDPILFASGDDLTFDGYTMRRNGRPEPVVGTTVMSHTVHRDFLDEPDAAVWDDTFAELAALDVNLVRTGVWAGWESMLAGDSVSEPWLRALEAYYLSARRHGIPVLFTFFAFMPPAYGGISPYFDERSLAGQRAYVGGVARRFARAKEMLWDLINEPSIASPAHVWSTRPNGDSAEAAAFVRWLRQTYPGTGKADTAWKEAVRRRWRLPPDQPIAVPREADFADVNIFVDRRPYRARDYIRFSQDAFRDWAADMVAAIRGAGSPAAVTVGQDEGGLTDRPNPLLHAEPLDFTSIHTWWLNDALLWDGVMARAPGQPLLVSETGIMRRERLSGDAHRTRMEAARLLERKLAYAFAAGAFGAVEWVYDVNPYMDSDNEVAIGLRRADGSYQPEHEVLRRFAAFVARTRHLFEEPRPPAVTVLVPSADLYSPRGLGERATRHAVAALARLGVVPRVVSEYRVGGDLDGASLIMLPAARGLSDSAWRAVTRAVEQGATLLASGYFEFDDAGLPAHRLGGTLRALGVVERVEASWLAADHLEYPLDVVQSVVAAVGAASERQVGRGRVLHYPTPLEWAAPGPVAAVYAHALRAAGVAVPAIRPETPAPGVFVTSLPFRDATLVVVVNEHGTSRVERLRGPMPGQVVEVTLSAGAAVMLWMGADGGVIDATGRATVGQGGQGGQ